MKNVIHTRRMQRDRVCTSEIVYAVHYNGKQKFELRWLPASDATYSEECLAGEQLFIRAVQGHSLTSVRAEEVLQLSGETELPKTAVHGTYWDFHKSVLAKGRLAEGPKKTRTPIHFAEGLPQARPLFGHAVLGRLGPLVRQQSNSSGRCDLLRLSAHPWRILLPFEPVCPNIQVLVAQRFCQQLVFPLQWEVGNVWNPHELAQDNA